MKVLTLVLLIAAPLAAQTLFTQTANPPFNPGIGAFNGVTADFNGDGNLDLAFMDEQNGGVTVLLGDGHGGFVAGPAGQCNGAEPVAMVAADFNGDGHIDIALESSLAGPNFLGQGSIQICLGDGTGKLTAYVGNNLLNPVLTGGNTGSMAVGDFNNDGIPDLVVSNQNGLTIQLGDGKGGFVHGYSPSGAGAVNGLIAVADFVGNHNSDIVVVNGAGLTVFVCDGKGGFTALPMNPKLAGGGVNIALADFNNDGFVDVVVGNSVLLGDGKGGFTAKGLPPLSAGQTRQAFSIADFNGDGNLDLAITDGTHASVLLGAGDGTFTAQPAAQFALGAPPEPDFGLAGDFNNDGKPDYVLVDGRVWLNTSTSITVSPKSILITPATKPVAVTVSPATGVTATATQSWLSYANGAVSANVAGLAPGIYHGKIVFSGSGLFGASVQVTLTVTAPSGTLTIVQGSSIPAAGNYYAGDFNGDGKPDLLVNDNSVLRVWFGDGTGNFSPASTTLAVPSNSSIALADFNLDGQLDIVISAFGSPAVQVYLGDGKGGFTSGPTTTLLPYNYALGFAALGVADFNLDGIPDLVIKGIVLLGDGKGGFTEVSPTSQPGVTASVAVGDFNGDGIPDFADTQLASSFVQVWLGDGKGGLTLSQRYDFSIGDPALGVITTEDFDGDGVLDLAISSAQHPGTIEILIGNGRGTFMRGNSFQIGQPVSINSLLASDFNGDGRLDLAAVSQNGTTILLGDGKGGLAVSPGGTLPVGTAAVVADFNSDGRPDIAGTGTGGVGIFLGGLAKPTITLKQVPPSPFDIGQTVSLMAQVTADPFGFQMPLGQIAFADGGTVLSTVPLGNGSAYITTPFVPKTHNFTATYSGDVRDATAMASLTVIENGAIAAIQPLGNGFPLQAVVTDINSNPVPGVRVTFSAPASGAGGLFAGNLTAAVLTDAHGIATAPTFISNGIPGTYAVTATTTIGGFVCTFTEMN